MSQDRAQPPLVVLTALGSRGDVNPMLVIAQGLIARGCLVRMLMPETYVPLATQLGIEALSVIDHEAFANQLLDPRIWQPGAGAKLLLNDLVPQALPGMVALLESLYQPGRTILVSHPLDFASRVFRELYPDVRLINLFLSPVVIRSLVEPPQVTDSRILAGAHHLINALGVMRPFMKGAFWCADKTLLKSWVERPLNRIRSQYGLPPVHRPMASWWYRADKVVCAFPRWFAPADLSSDHECIGFPLFDGPEAFASEEESLQGFTAERPLVFTAGSAHYQSSEFFRVMIEICRQQHLPGIMVAPKRDLLPSSLPANVIWSPYVSFSQLLPRARAIVHHGGVGTTSQAFAAGIPQFCCPMAYDQFDNAMRVTRLGVGTWWSMSRLSQRRFAGRLLEFLEDHSFTDKAEQLKNHIASSEQFVQEAIRCIVQ